MHDIEWLLPDDAVADCDLKYRVQSFVRKHTGKVIVVDTCIGSERQMVSMPERRDFSTTFLDDGEAVGGCAVDQVDLVLCTHLQMDHKGWHTRMVDGRWRPTAARVMRDRAAYRLVSV